jgi:aspartyl aminopeptidase
MNTDAQKKSEEMIAFIKKSPSCFHAVATIASMLSEAGFREIEECHTWKLEKNGAYYVIRNNSSIIAFRVGKVLPDSHFQIAAAHSDSPGFKVKEKPEITGPGGMLSLNTEGYGSMIDSTWFDRPLSLAGRVMIKKGTTVESRLIDFGRPVLLIPNVALHFNRDINRGIEYNHQTDLLPLASAGECGKGSIDDGIADILNIPATDILSRDLFLVNKTEPCIWGIKNEFVSSPKLDDLQCAFSAAQAFASSRNDTAINVLAVFDNEEVGSITKQGAAGTFLADTLRRIVFSLGLTEQEYYRACAASYLVSCDNAHAVHPNHPEKTDTENRAFMNRGIVIKESANQKYTSDAPSKAVFKTLCDKAGIPVQVFSNRSDMPGGSTLGNLSNQQASMNAVDIGIAQLAMHSSYETCGVQDTAYMIRALQAFYTTDIEIRDRNTIAIGN